MKADLHIHSTFSDGVRTPEELAEQAAAQQLDWFALTDHDSFDGARLLRRLQPELRLLPGVELSMRDIEGLHLLCYGWKEDTPLHTRVRELAEARVNRAGLIMDRCEAAGLPVDREYVRSIAGGSIGRPHIAQGMIRAGYVRTVQEAFDRYLDVGRPCYVSSNIRMTISEAIPLALRSGFVPVLAHPWEIADSEPAVRALVTRFTALGLMGLEVYHPSASKHGYEFLEHLAEDCGLLITGGSDFHRPGDRHGSFGWMSEAWHTCDRDVIRLINAMQQSV